MLLAARASAVFILSSSYRVNAHVELGRANRLIEQGRLVATWPAEGQAPLLQPNPGTAAAQTPASVSDAEEAHLIWRWLLQPGVRVVDSTGPLAVPRHPVPELERLDVA